MAPSAGMAIDTLRNDLSTFAVIVVILALAIAPDFFWKQAKTKVDGGA